jgi:homoserine O-succinyltransferase
MPLIIDGGRIPTRWAEKRRLSPAGLLGSQTRAECIKIALINNMPDPALEDTELQFFELLDRAAGNTPVLLQLHSLPEVPHSDKGQQHLSDFYFDINELRNNRFDGVIITGTEPKQANLRNEPYWDTLADVLDWAERNTTSTVLSCLAAHASVLHSDGINRHPLSDKQFGVFAYTKPCDHPMTARTANLVRIPHSRWNEVQEDALTSCGYVVLTKSTEAGVDLFVKEKGKSLFVHFQGHPEYGALTLLKEYRRDLRRFLTQERETYPSMPHGYFDADAAKLLSEFRENAVLHRDEELMDVFPEAAVADTLENTWNSSANSVYRNWLQYLASRKSETPAFSSVGERSLQCQGDRSAVRPGQ